MSCAVTMLTLLAAAAPGSPTILPLTLEVQRLPLKATAVEIDSLRSELRISGVANVAAVAKKHHGGLCPRASADGATLVLQCVNKKLHARVTKDELFIYRLRGLPWADRGDPTPIASGHPEQLGFGGPCPGTTLPGRAECAFASGDYDNAEKLLTETLSTGDNDYAIVRLGDLALMHDEPVKALEWYEKLHRGVWGRLSLERSCSITNYCDLTRVYDAAGMPAPLAAELKLRQVRRARIEMGGESALELLNELEGGRWPNIACDISPGTCNSVLLAAFRSGDPAAQIEALALYAQGPLMAPGPLRPVLSRAAGDAAAAVGAPRYGAAVMAAATPDVPKAELADYLLRVVELYLLGGDRARAATIHAYAIDTFGPQVKREQRWRAVTARLPERPVVVRPAPDRLPDPDLNELTNELASATLALSRARHPAPAVAKAPAPADGEAAAKSSTETTPTEKP